MRKIDADALRQVLEVYSEKDSLGHTPVQLCDAMPTIDAVPVRHGEWIYVTGSNGKDYRKCSECLHTQEITGLLNYCPICGAEMKGEEDE